MERTRKENVANLNKHLEALEGISIEAVNNKLSRQQRTVENNRVHFRNMCFHVVLSFEFFVLKKLRP